MEKENPCLKHNCNACCNPVKLKEGFKDHKKDEFDKLPFKDRGGILIPKEERGPIKLESYDCTNLNKETGKCNDYENRPQICKNTKCRAFDTKDEKEQKEIIDDIKSQEFIICKR